MANITAKDVQALRALTGVGMMECKNALVEANGDIDKAVLILREKGLAAAEKKASRIAAEGVITVATKGQVSVVLEVNAETDFVAQNKEFLTFVDHIAETILQENPTDVEDLKLKTMQGSTETVAETLQDRILVIGENMNIRRFQRVEGVIETYLHGNKRIGVLVEFDADEKVLENDAFKEAAKDIAMQIAAATPTYVNKEEVPAEEVQAEKDFLKQQVIDEGKPEHIAEKIVEGRLGKFYEGIVLLEQPFVKDGSISVAEYLKNTGKEVGFDLGIKAFYRYEVGEGLEKKEENFADEVAEMMK